MQEFQDLMEIIKRLRGPGGCAWDRAQTPLSMCDHLLEECHETMDAIEHASPADVCGELGDLLFLTTMIARMYEEQGSFTIQDSLRAASEKMVYRHPHIFGDALEAPNWTERKHQESGRESLLDGIPRNLSSLARAQRLGSRAAHAGFDWPEIDGVLDKIIEEVQELREAHEQGNPRHIEEELGDVLFSVVNLARHLHVSADASLRGANRKFETRFRHVEQRCLAAGSDVFKTDVATLEAFWTSAKGSNT